MVVEFFEVVVDGCRSFLLLVTTAFDMGAIASPNLISTKPTGFRKT